MPPDASMPSSDAQLYQKIRAIFDETPVMDETHLELMRRMTPSERLSLTFKLSTEAKLRAKQVIARARPELTAREVEHLYVELLFGRELADALRRHDAKREHESKP